MPQLAAGPHLLPRLLLFHRGSREVGHHIGCEQLCGCVSGPGAFVRTSPAITTPTTTHNCQRLPRPLQLTGRLLC